MTLSGTLGRRFIFSSPSCPASAALGYIKPCLPPSRENSRAYIIGRAQAVAEWERNRATAGVHNTFIWRDRLHCRFGAQVQHKAIRCIIAVNVRLKRWLRLHRTLGVAPLKDVALALHDSIMIIHSLADFITQIKCVCNLCVCVCSACTSASLEPSYVLRAIGADEDLAHSSIRYPEV